MSRYNNHVLPTTRMPNISDEWTSDQILNIIGYVLMHQIKTRIIGIKMKGSEDDPKKYIYNRRFKYQYYIDKEHAIIYIYYDLTTDLEGLLDRGGVENIRERINNYMIDKLRFDTGYTPKILTPKVYYKDYRQDKWLSTSREYVPVFTVGLWKNKTTGTIEFIQDRDVFIFLLKQFRSKAYDTPNHNHTSDDPLTNNDTLDNIIANINDYNIRLSLQMKEEFAEVNQRNRESTSEEKETTDQIIISTYNDYRNFIYNQYNITLPEYNEEDSYVRVLNYDYDNTYKNIIKKNSITNFNVSV